MEFPANKLITWIYLVQDLFEGRKKLRKYDILSSVVFALSLFIHVGL